MATEKEKRPPQLSYFENLGIKVVAAGTSVVYIHTALAPIERVKLLLQNQNEMLKQGTISRPYTGAIDCTMQIFKNEFFHSFWRGNLTNCMFRFSERVIGFLIYDKTKPILDKYNSNMGTYTKFLVSGGISSVIPLGFVYSLDYARTRLATDVKNITGTGVERKYDGLIDVYKKTLATDGVRGLYRGFPIACAAIFIGRGCSLGLYDIFKPVINKREGNLSLSFLLGYTVTLIPGLISYPLDTIQRRMMMTSGEAIKYRHSADCTVQIIRNEGATAFFKGVGVHIIKCFAAAGLLVGYDKLIQFYTSVKVDTSGGG